MANDNKVKLQVESFKNTETPDTSLPRVVVTDDNGNAKVNKSTGAVITKYQPLMKDNAKVYSKNIKVTFIPTEGAVVPKVLSKANIESMSKEFSATYSKGLCYKEDSKYILKKSNTFEFTDEDTGTLIQRISAIYTPIFKPMKSSLSF